MASRRAQVRQVFQSVPPSDTQGSPLEALYAKCESNLAAVDAWATQGNQRAVRQAGTGLVAICAWLAAKSLADNPRMQAFQHISGLSPAQFAASERELAPGVQRIAAASSSASTPRKDRHASQAGTSMSARSNASAAADAVAQWAESMKSGVSPSKGSSGLLTPLSRRRADATGNRTTTGSEPSTPSRSGLRDRSTIKSKTTFDPSPVTTPMKVRRPASGSVDPARLASSPQKKARPESVGGTPSSSRISTPLTVRKVIEKPSEAKGAEMNIPLHYPVALGFHLDDPDSGKRKWNGEQAHQRIRRLIDALNESDYSDEWEHEFGMLESVRIV